MNVVSRLLARGVEAALVLLLAALVLLIGFETVAWAALAVSIPQAGEIQGLLSIWFGFLGAVYGVQQGFHLSMELLARRLPPTPRRLVGRLAAAAVASFGVLLIRYGWELTGSVFNTLPATGWPASVQYLPSWVSGVALCWFAGERLVRGDRPAAAEGRR